VAVSAARRLEEVRARIARAAERAKRDPASVRLLAVSKTQPASAVREAYDAGQRAFGENYVQELSEKSLALAALPDLEWHFIGHLQRNKVKDVLRATAAPVIHTVDSTRLADELARRAGDAKVRVLLQVNVAREPQKSGVLPEELPALLAHARTLPSLDVRGLMTIPPDAEPEDARPHFRALRSLAEAHALPELSMGMSADLEVAIEEGATIVRVGTAIFGARARG
jgi:pyridoxal phosphate enzyme (YggS family)